MLVTSSTECTWQSVSVPGKVFHGIQCTLDAVTAANSMPKNNSLRYPGLATRKLAELVMAVTSHSGPMAESARRQVKYVRRSNCH